MYTDFIYVEDDFVEAALAALPDYLNKENTRNLLTIHLDRLKEVEVALVDLAEGRLLENAEGVILDEIGEQLNKPRNGLNDASFRSSLNIYQASMNNSGTRSEANETLSSLFPDSSYFLYKGKNYRIDLYAKSECFEVDTLPDDIKDIFPVITHLRILELPLSGMPFGFEGDINSGGFSSSTNRTSIDSGKLCRIVYTSDKDIHGHT